MSWWALPGNKHLVLCTVCFYICISSKAIVKGGVIIFPYCKCVCTYTRTVYITWD